MKQFVTAVLVLTLVAGVSVAEEQESFWGGLLKKINKIVSHSPRGKTYTSVVGVRGAKEDTSSDSLYWKGKEVPEAETYSDAEIEAFKNAIVLAEQGQEQQAIQAFTTFQEEYPDSRLGSDAAMAVDKLKSSIDEKENLSPAE